MGFEIFDVAADRRLREVDDVSSFRKTLGFDDLTKDVELPDIHGVYRGVGDIV